LIAVLLVAEGRDVRQAVPVARRADTVAQRFAHNPMLTVKAGGLPLAKAFDGSSGQYEALVVLGIDGGAEACCPRPCRGFD
jgi:hypothetical protein